MSGEESIQKSEFENIVHLIQEARNRAFSKVNEELVLLYFNVGQVVSVKVAGGIWGERTIDDLSNYIAAKMPGLSGFNRRGLYRMKQFYETYSFGSDCYNLWLNVQEGDGQNPIVSPIATQLKTAKTSDNVIVSSLPTQLQSMDNQHSIFVSTLLTQLTESMVGIVFN